VITTAPWPLNLWFGIMCAVLWLVILAVVLLMYRD